MRRKQAVVSRVARALGASRVLRLGRVDHTPVGLLALTERVRRLRSTGPRGSGRPGDPTCTVPRIVKFTPTVWRRLARIADRQSRLTGIRVSPAQVASILIDETVRVGGRQHRRAGLG